MLQVYRISGKHYETGEAIDMRVQADGIEGATAKAAKCNILVESIVLEQSLSPSPPPSVPPIPGIPKGDPAPTPRRDDPQEIPQKTSHRWWLLIIGLVVLITTPLYPIISLLFGASILFLCLGVFIPQVKGTTYRIIKIDPTQRWRKGLRLTTYGLIGFFFVLLAWSSFGMQAQKQRAFGRQAAAVESRTVQTSANREKIRRERNDEERMAKEAAEKAEAGQRGKGLAAAEAIYTVVQEKMLNDALIMSVATEHLDRAEDIAHELVSKNKSNYMVRVFFYKADDTPGKDVPAIQYEWTKAEGLKKTFDTRLPAPPEDPDPSLPEYDVIFTVKQMNGRVYGEILVPSLSRSASVEEREQLARDICKHETLDDIDMYMTEDAQKANTSSSFAREHPNALREGFLGSLRDGNFVPGESLFP